MIPQLTAEQRAQARSMATAARRVRADVKKQLGEGALTLSSVLDRAKTDEALANMYVVDLLKALPRVGQRRAEALMDKHEIAANRRVRGLGSRQIAGLTEDFG